MRTTDAKLYVALGAAATLFALMILNALNDPTKIGEQTIYILLAILIGTLNLDLFRPGGGLNSEGEKK